MWGRLFVVILLVSTAGCSAIGNLPFTQGDASPGSPTASPSTTAPVTGQAPTGNPKQVRLTLPEVGNGYNLSSQSTQELNASEGRQSRFNVSGVTTRYESVFTLQSDAARADTAEVIYSSVVTFDSAGAAEHGINNFLASLPTQDGNRTTVEVTNGLTATRITFKQGASEYNTVVIEQEGAMVYFVVTSDTESYQIEQTESLFFEMAVDI